MKQFLKATIHDMTARAALGFWVLAVFMLALSLWAHVEAGDVSGYSMETGRIVRQVSKQWYFKGSGAHVGGFVEMHAVVDGKPVKWVLSNDVMVRYQAALEEVIDLPITVRLNQNREIFEVQSDRSGLVIPHESVNAGRVDAAWGYAKIAAFLAAVAACITAFWRFVGRSEKSNREEFQQ